jgi:hypothetical protein
MLANSRLNPGRRPAFGRELDAAWFRKRYAETGDKRYLRLARETEAWLKGRKRVR